MNYRGFLNNLTSITGGFILSSIALLRRIGSLLNHRILNGLGEGKPTFVRG
jgi:hypothetical protein